MFSSPDYAHEFRIKQRISRYDFEADIAVIGRELVGKSVSLVHQR